MDKIYLKNELVTGDTLTPDGVLAYIALRKIMDESAVIRGKESTLDCISVNRIAYSLIGMMKKYDKAFSDALIKGVYELVDRNILTIIQPYQNEWILDFQNMYLNTEIDKYTIIIADEVKKILSINGQMKRNISMLKYFVALVSTFDWSDSMKSQGTMPDLQGKLTHMPQDYIADQAGISVKTCRRYNDILVDYKVIYIYKSNDKIKFDDSLKQINNCYSRYEDRELCRLYASNYESAMGYQHKIVKTRKKKEQADNNRRLAQIYNRICEGYGDSYDNATIRDVYLYVQNMNKYIQSEIDKKYRQKYMTESDKVWVEKLKSKLRDMSVFEQFDFLKSTNNSVPTSDDWGEPDPMENDIPVENNEPVVCEVQSDLAKETDSDLHSERVNPKMGGQKFERETVSQKSSERNDLELIDIESLFDEDTHDRPVLSEDEAWELFS